MNANNVVLATPQATTITNLLNHAVKQQQQIDELLNHWIKQEQRISDLKYTVDELRRTVNALTDISAVSLDEKSSSDSRLKLSKNAPELWKTNQIIDFQTIMNGCAKANKESSVSKTTDWDDSSHDWKWK